MLADLGGMVFDHLRSLIRNIDCLSHSVCEYLFCGVLHSSDSMAHRVIVIHVLANCSDAGERINGAIC
jgi:hypothetical protein